MIKLLLLSLQMKKFAGVKMSKITQSIAKYNTHNSKRSDNEVKLVKKVYIINKKVNTRIAKFRCLIFLFTGSLSKTSPS